MYLKVHQEIQKKIDREKNIIQGASNLKRNTDNSMVIQKCNTSIRESRQNIEYLEEQLKKLQVSSNQQTQQAHFQEDNGDKLQKGYGQLSIISPNEHIFSRLDLVKYDCPSLSQRIQYMLQQLEFKLQVERQYQEANAKLTKLYQIDGDRRSSSAAEGGAMESKNRIQLLTKSLKKYQAINVDLDQGNKHDTGALGNALPKFRRKQLTGNLNIGFSAVRDVDHIQSPMFSRKPETFIVVKIDDAIKTRSKYSRNDRWSESFNIPVDKGNEVEIIIYDKMNDSIVPVAIIWFLLADIAEELRKKKVGQTSEQQGWVNASRVINSSLAVQSSEIDATVKNMENFGDKPNLTSLGSDPINSSMSVNQVTVNSWFVLEPTGQILLTLGFDKSIQPQKSNAVGGLHRHGAIINRKKEVFEQHGHHFVQKSFYNIMCCAYCGDFLRYSGFQCQDCKFLCHKKCYTNVVTKCIAKSELDDEADDAKLNHHIPHRFEPASNRGTKWCCHCGYILLWGKHKVRKCSECGIMCHNQCAHLVPDFCGVTMEMANKILKTIQDAKRNQEQRKKLPPVEKQRLTAVCSNEKQRDIGATTPNLEYPSATIQKYPSYEAPHSTSYSSRQAMDKTYHSPEWVKPTASSRERQAIANDHLNNFLDENETYNSFTASAGSNMSPEEINSNRMSQPDTNVQQLTQTQSYYSDQFKYDNDDQVMQDEADLWKQQRVQMEQDLQQEAEQIKQAQWEQEQLLEQQQQEHHYKNRNDILPLETDQKQKIHEPVESLKEEIISEPQSSNPFRDMNREAFEREQVISSKNANEGVMPSRSSVNSSPQKSQVSGKHRKKSPRRRKVSLDDFILLEVLGKGNFGKVLLSKSKNTDRICAIKVLKKDHIIQNHDIESARAEKKVFLLATKAKHPFLTNLYCSFQTENRIYFAMEFIGGGDLMWHVQNQRLSVRRAKFYSAEVLLAMKYFHDNGVIYRDLKLENILLTPEGHIKIADYGLCKYDMWYGNKTSTFCGTPEFMAPEILKEQAYTKAVDWWAFGVLLYQMLLCQSPFSGDDEDEVFNAILTDEPLYPIDMAGDIVQIFQGLLTKEPEQRLGAGPRDALEIMEEPFFHNINFDDVLNLRVQPPYIPKITSPEDTSYFEKEFTSAPPTLTPLPSVLTTTQQEEFRGFSFMPNDLEL